jgi:hypothetical protein
MEFASAPPRFGSVAVDLAVFYHNELPHIQNEKKEPTSRRCMFEGHDVMWNMESARAFGSLAIVWIPPPKRQEGKTWTQKKAWKGIMMGYDPHSLKAYRVWDPKKQKLRGVPYEFNTSLEHVLPFKDKKNWTAEDLSSPSAYVPEPDHLLVGDEWELFQFTEEESEQAARQVLPRMSADDLLPIEPRLYDEKSGLDEEPDPQPRVVASGDSERDAFLGSDVTEWRQANPKRSGSDSHARYEGYKGAKTVQEALELGATRADIAWDLKKGFVVVGGVDARLAQAFLGNRLN